MLPFDPALPTILRRSLKRAVLTLWREGQWRASFGSLLGVALLLQFLLLGILGTAAAESLLLSHSDLKLEIRADASRGEIQQFFSVIQQQPYIERATYLTREQVLAQAAVEDPDLAAFLEKFGVSNPFPETIAITLKSLRDYPVLSAFLLEPQWQRVTDPTLLSAITHQEERVHELLNVARGSQALAGILLALAGVILLGSIVEFTRRNALNRADEIRAGRIMGADALSLALPFVWEATLLLWLSIAVSAVILLCFLLILPSLAPALSSAGVLVSLRSAILPLLMTLLPAAFVIELLLTPCFAGLGTWLAIRKT